MNRTYIKDLKNNIDKKVTIAGWVDVRRDHGKLIFLDVRDKTGVLQAVSNAKNEKAHGIVDTLHGEWVVALTGVVNKRPEKMINPELLMGDIEMSIEEVQVLSEAQELPFEKDAELNLDTYLDNLPLTLRRERSRDIFTIQASAVEAFREAVRKEGFVEYQNPVLVGGDGEGGASAFRVDYYNNKKAFLATSPQLYKQMMVGVFERVFTTAKIFRAEKHATTRHLSEVVQMDFEMGFIESHEDVMSMLQEVIRHMVETLSEKHADILKRFNVPAPLVSKTIPRLTLREAQAILEKERGIACVGELDLEPEHERQICEWAKEKHKSDFVFITHFPTEKRPFYTFIDEKDPAYTKSFDLLFRGLEINSGSQRVHNFEELVRRMRAKGLDPEVFSFYLQAFKYGMPPHGGCSTGLERFTARFLNLPNVKEATLFPRDINRIDKLLSE
ncbi:MAG TPA: aspartate--tRNA(Asn) ligase [Candidatus Paceibacterota bacterium]